MGLLQTQGYRLPGGGRGTLGSASKGLDMNKKYAKSSIWGPTLTAGSLAQTPERQDYRRPEETLGAQAAEQA